MSSCASVGQVCKELSILYSHKEELLEAFTELSNCDIQRLSQDLSNFLVLNSDIANIFANLDYDKTDPLQRARYLLNHIFESIENNTSAFTKTLKVFSSQGGIFRQLVLKINKSVSLQHSDQAVPVTKEILLDNNDVYILVKILVECSHKWELLGIELRLPTNVIEECKSSDNNTVRLYKVMSAWVTGKYTQAKEATLSNLKEALASVIVGEGRVALNLEENFHTAKQPSTNFETLILPDEIDSLFQIEFCSGETKVSDGKSTLLEVQVCPSKSVFYQWMKNGEPLSDNVSFKGTQSNFLCINKASQGTEGKYCCKVICKSDQLLSPVATVTIVYEKDKQHLLSLYSTLEEIPADTWPQIHGGIFIDVALIKATKLQHKGSKIFTEKDVDKYLENKEKVTYKDAFCPFEKGALVLVEGRPGSGKTTLANKLAKDWAKGTVLKNANRVFLVSLRKKQDKVKLFKYFFPIDTEAKISLMEESGGDGVCFILDGYDEYHTKDENSIIHELINHNFLPFSMIILTSRPVGTTNLRPRATKRIEVLGFTNKKFSEYIECYPFDELVEGKDIVTIRSKAMTYLKKCSQVWGMCYLPVNASMICFLCSQQLEDNIPQTETELYKNFILAVLLRELRRRNPTAQLSSITDFEGEDRNCFDKLCTLAFNMTIANEQVVHNLPKHTYIIKDSIFVSLLSIDHITKMHKLEDVTCFLHLTLQEYLAAYHLSCLDEDEQMKMIVLHSGKSHMLTTFKFYCGLVSFQNRMFQFEEIIKSVNRDRLYTFHCAYETQESSVCSKTVEILHGQIRIVGLLTATDFTVLGYVISKSSHPITSVEMSLCQLYEEFIDEQIESVFPNGAESLEANAAIYNNYLTKSLCIGMNVEESQFDYMFGDDYSLEYTNSLCGVVIAYKNMFKSLSDVLSSDCAEPFIAALKHCKTIRNLTLKGNYSSTKAAHIIADILWNSAHLEMLLINGVVESTGAAIISEGLQSCKKLETIDLGFNYFYLDSEGSLSRGLIHCNNLKTLNPTGSLNEDGAAECFSGMKSVSLLELNLNFNSFGQKGVQALVSNINFLSLNKLNLHGNNIGSEGAITLAGLLLHCPLLLELDLCNNNISLAGIIALAQGLSSCTNLKCLGLSFNDIGPEGAEVLKYGIIYCINLNILLLDSCNLESLGIEEIAEIFTSWKHLEVLKISNNEILLTTSIAFLKSQIKVLSNLSALYMSHSGINDHNAIELAEGLQYCPKLHTLDLSHNSISSDGLAMICYTLQCSKIKHFNFSHNCIDSNSIEALTYLMEDIHVEKLNLSHNNIDSEGALTLVSNIVYHNQSLKLNLSFNSVSPEAMESVEAMLRDQKDIKIVM